MFIKVSFPPDLSLVRHCAILAAMVKQLEGHDIVCLWKLTGADGDIYYFHCRQESGQEIVANLMAEIGSSLVTIDEISPARKAIPLGAVVINTTNLKESVHDALSRLHEWEGAPFSPPEGS